ncbi:hypothetical protein Acsp06_42040 [Actinomycetospora sp. NBRC 106375]|uniref:hypothetical protein n=1 Tax=Actinomycetospora sp. NBRC 106375 TaxID=3032207 RepID=UPI0024A3A0BE|nr:hypothetical protein [Actinomycetospora sp. NBRC 106375]GLZ48019.1 hypothetical protein Acsp06_42040 [Actinomycetospora sp. NBRC 106375]
MVGDITPILLAISLLILLAGVLRYTFGRGPTGALPDENGDLGLLETVATVPTREAADVLVAKLAREKVRVTVSRGEDGWRLLAFPADAADARVVLHSM